MIDPSNSVKNDTVTNDVENDMVNPNDVKNDRGIEHTLSPTPASARRSPRSGVEPFADVGGGEEIIKIKEVKEMKKTTTPIIFNKDDPVKDKTEHDSSLDSKPGWAIDFDSDDKEDDNDEPFSTIQQTTVSPPPLPLFHFLLDLQKPPLLTVIRLVEPLLVRMARFMP